MTTITKTYELPHGLWKWYLVRDEAEAVRIAAGRTCYFYKSTIIQANYLFVAEEMES